MNTRGYTHAMKTLAVLSLAATCGPYAFGQAVIPPNGNPQKSIIFEQEAPKPKERISEQNSLFIVGGDKADVKDNAFSPSLLASFQDSEMEWWFNIPPGSVPYLAKTTVVYTNQVFSIFPFIYNASTRRGKFNVTYSVKADYPDNTTTVFVDKASFEGEKKFDDIIIACPDVLEVRFDKKYKTGRYKFTMTARDNIGGAESSCFAYMDLKTWQAPPPLTDTKNLDALIRSFYLTPSPELLYSLFFSPALNLEQKDAPNSLNYTYIGFFRTAFKRNMFLIPYIRNSFANATPLDRAKTIFLFKILEIPEIDGSLLTSREKDYISLLNKAEFPNPYESWHPVIGAAQIDMLWGEFFANGRYRPVRRIIDLLANSKEGAFARDMVNKRRKPATRKEWARFMIGVLHRAALNTVVETASRVPLVRKYCCWAVDNRDIPESTYNVLNPIFGKDASGKDGNPFEGKAEEIRRFYAPKIFKSEGK